MSSPEGDYESLLTKAHEFEKKITDSAQNRENTLIFSHYAPDGLCASALLQEHIRANGGHAQIRCTGQPSVRNLERLQASKFDLVIFVDVCSGLSSELRRIFGDRWLVIDHHWIEADEMNESNVFNCFQFGFDGSTAVSSSGLSYFVSERSRTPRSAFLAISGALADGQDVGPRRTFVSLNEKILQNEGETFKGVRTAVDLLFLGRESRPIHESIALTATSFIMGLTGNKDACLASLRSAGVELKSGNRWRTVADYSEDEKQQILEAIVPHLPGTTLTVQDLVGTIYSLSSEDEYSIMRDARDFASLLNACSRLGKCGIAIPLALGADGEYQGEAENSLAEYTTDLVRCVQTLLSSEERIVERGGYILFIGDGIVADRMCASVCQVLASSSRVRNKVVLLRTTNVDGEVKVSIQLARHSFDSSREKKYNDLGQIAKQIGKATMGVGGGVRNIAGARFSIARQQEFQSAVDSLFPSSQST